MYAVHITPAADRILKKLPDAVQQALTKAAQQLQENPLLGEPLYGRYRHLRSVHLTHEGVSYRIIYQVFTHTESVIIYLADKRENIYKRLVHMGY
jgi:mRNA-degrading endonuclease RelE of RelBE toxin-antitoxin system